MHTPTQQNPSKKPKQNTIPHKTPVRAGVAFPRLVRLATHFSHATNARKSGGQTREKCTKSAKSAEIRKRVGKLVRLRLRLFVTCWWPRVINTLGVGCDGPCQLIGFVQDKFRVLIRGSYVLWVYMWFFMGVFCSFYSILRFGSIVFDKLLFWLNKNCCTGIFRLFYMSTNWAIQK